MLVTLLVFSLLVYGLAFLVADAKIFGCPTKAFLKEPTDVEYIRNAGVIPFRNILLKSHFFQLLFECYFCMGVWCGAVIHLLLTLLHRLDNSVPLLDSYPLLSSSVFGIVVTTLLASILGAVVCYLTDLVVQVLESKVGSIDGHT